MPYLTDSWETNSKDKTVVIKRNNKEYIEVIRHYYPQLASALETTFVTFKLSGISFKSPYPSIYLTHHNNENRLSVTIDFSIGLTFFIKPEPLGETTIKYSGFFLEEFNKPEELNLNNIEELMYQLAFQNYLYEKEHNLNRG